MALTNRGGPNSRPGSSVLTFAARSSYGQVAARKAWTSAEMPGPAAFWANPLACGPTLTPELANRLNSRPMQEFSLGTPP